MGLASHLGPVKIIPQTNLAGSGGLVGQFADEAGKVISGAVTGGIINGAEKINIWIVVVAIAGTLGVLAESSPDGINETSGGSLGSKTGITVPGTYLITYNGAPVSLMGLRWTLGTSADTATIAGIFFEGSLA